MAGHECKEVVRLREAISAARDVVNLGPPETRGEGISLLLQIDRILLLAEQESIDDNSST